MRSSERTRANSSGWLIGLLEEVVGAGVEALDALLRRVERRDEHDRQHRVRRIGADAPAHVVAAHARHHHVEQDEVGLLGSECRQRLVARRSRCRCA